MRFLLYTLALFAVLNLSAQAPGNNSAMMKAMKDIKGRVYGTLVDASTGKPVPFAPVVVLWYNKDSLMGGAIADDKGEFNIENLPPMGSFRFRVKYAGYKTYETRIYIQLPNKIEQDLGDIKLQIDEKMLEVEVTAEKSNVSLSIDKRTYNVDKDLSVKGGTGVDVMKNVPGVTVDSEGNAQLRNQSPMIFVDGRPTNLTLQQIPADQIERVEVITNPSVKYDASASGGILNIILKKNSKPGYNGMVMTYVGTGDRYGGMMNLNVKEGKWNFTSMYSYNQGINYTKGYTKRTQLDSDKNPSGYFNQDNNTFQRMQFNFAKLGADYTISNRQTISLNGMLMGGKIKSSDKQGFSILDKTEALRMSGVRLNDQNANWQNTNAQLLYRRTYAKPGKELTADLNYNYTTSKNGYQFNTWAFLNPDTLHIPYSVQKNSGYGLANQYVFQLDFVNPESDTKKFEAGMKSYYKESSSVNNASSSNDMVDYYTRDSVMSNNYRITDMINAAYVNYSSKMKWDINYQAGLRFEQSYYYGKILDKNQTFSYNYPGTSNDILKSLFPGVYFSKKFSKGHEWQLNFSRKIQRPNFFQLMPVVMFADKQNYRIGNPSLRPEFRNISELNYNKTYDNGSYLGSVYFRYEEQPITDVAYPSVEDPTVLVNTTVNGKNSFRYGTEHTWKHTFVKKFDLTLNVQGFYLYMNGKVVPTEPEVTTKGFAATTKMTFVYRMPKSWSAQLNASYETPRILLLGYTLPVYGMDLSVNKNINMKWMFNLTLSDVFNTRRMGTIYDTPYYKQELSRRRETRYLRFSVTYIFGKMDASIFKRGKQMRGMGDNQGNSDGLDFGR